jgi:hypothetical protein
MESDGDDIREIRELLSELSAEVDLLAKPSLGESGTHKMYPDPAQLSPVERRLLVKSVFSFIEAVVFKVKMVALMAEKADSLSAGEVALAKEEDYELDDSGTVKTRPARLRFRSNFRFAFALAAKACEIDWQLDVAGTGWQALGDALPVRDRLMHPKKTADLVVTDNEVRNSMKAYEWVFDQLGHMAAAALLRHQRQLGRAKRHGAY